MTSIKSGQNLLLIEKSDTITLSKKGSVLNRMIFLLHVNQNADTIIKRLRMKVESINDIYMYVLME